MGQITLRKSTTGTVVNHKEESSLRGEEFVIGGREGGFPIPGESGSDDVPKCLTISSPAVLGRRTHLYCHLETNEGVAAVRPIGRR